jgi:hypothetical protein
VSRVHELGRLSRPQLVSRWAALMAGKERAVQEAVAGGISNEQLICSIITLEETAA